MDEYPISTCSENSMRETGSAQLAMNQLLLEVDMRSRPVFAKLAGLSVLALYSAGSSFLTVQCPCNNMLKYDLPNWICWLSSSHADVIHNLAVLLYCFLYTHRLRTKGTNQTATQIACTQQ